jgi:predicted cobalt transporter CbtA
MCPAASHIVESQTMSRRAVNVLYVFAMVAVVIGVDLLFFRHHIWLRLVVNVGIVLVFVLSYFRFVKRQ